MPALSPAAILLILLATACASLAHVLWGQRWVQLPIFWLAACLGCLVAYGIGYQLPLNLPAPAGVPVFEAVMAAWILLVIASRLWV
ncbi:MAG: hypothetical protein HC876_23495 [Chloroflexaceae bacterium]|nr:hypothetical protein [Chloroflexaceae bacterium]NJO08229.1 hypothetical protein [Chloroflexaceae bacterium]